MSESQPPGTEEEKGGHRLTLARAFEILGDHFPGLDAKRRKELAQDLATAEVWSAATGYWGGHSDRVVLDAIGKSIERLKKQLGKLSDDGQRAFNAGAVVWRKDHRGREFPLGVMPEEMLAKLDSGVRRARISDDIGKKTKAAIRAATIAHECQIVWQRATGTTPPNYVSADSQLEQRGPFHDFASCVLCAAGESISVASALRVWRQLVSSSDKSPG